MNRNQQTLTYYEFLDYVERCLEEYVRGSFPRNWDEDFITRNVLKALRNLGHEFSLNTVSFSSLTWFRLSQSCKIQVEWDLYKLTGKTEKHFGDIAIYVISAFPNKIRMEGVAFAKAKKFIQ